MNNERKLIWRVFTSGKMELTQNSISNMEMDKKIVNSEIPVDYDTLLKCRDSLLDINLEISPLVRIGQWGVPAINIVIKLNKHDSLDIFNGLPTDVVLPLDSIKKLIAERLKLDVRDIYFPRLIHIEKLSTEYVRMCQKLTYILANYESYCNSLNRRKDEEEKARQSKIFTNKLKVEKLLAEGVRKPVKDLKVNFQNIPLSGVYNGDNYYDIESGEIRLKYNLNLITNGTNSYRNSIVLMLRNLLIKMPGYVIDSNGDMIEVDYWNSLEVIMGCGHNNDGHYIFTKTQDYAQKREVNTITNKDGSPYVCTNKFTLYVSALISKNITRRLSDIIFDIKAFNKSIEIGAVCDDPSPECEVTPIPYGNFSYKKVKRMPAYEEIDSYDMDEYVDIDSIINNHYSNFKNFIDDYNEEDEY